MKNLTSKIQILIACFLLINMSLIGQSETDSLGLPGDNFSLQGALEIFKNSKNLEDFEKKLNEEDNYVNNLDLNEDGDTDYIRVEDNMDGDVHAIVLQVPVNEKESQDVAVIEIEKTGNETAILQIIGDEELYGENYIVEPFEEEASSEGKGPNADYDIVRVVVNVYFWSPVRVVYTPGYVVYRSPWAWALYPKWWRPWRPHPYRWHYNRRAHYHVHYRPVHVHRVTRAHTVYTPRRRSSTVVRTKTVKRNAVASRNNNVGNKKVVASKTTTKKVNVNGNTVAGKKTTTKVGAKKDGNGNAAIGKSKTTQKGVQGKNAAAGKKTTTQVGAKKDKDGNVTVGKRTKTEKGVKGKNNSAKVTKTKTTKVKKGNKKAASKKTKKKKTKRKKN